MTALPESDAVAHVKVKQLLNEAMPRILANNPAKLAEAFAARGVDGLVISPAGGEQLTYDYSTVGDHTIQCRCRPGCWPPACGCLRSAKAGTG